MIATRSTAEERGAEHTRLPVLVGGAVWSNLPLLLVLDAALLVGAIPVVVLFFAGGALLAPLVAVLTLGPLWAGTVASTDRMIRDEVVRLRDFAGNVRRYAVRGVLVSLVPALVTVAILGTLIILEARPEAQWLLVPLLADGSVAILVALTGFSVFSLATTGGLRGWTLWRASLEVVVASPMTALGTVALLVLLGLLVSWAPGLLAMLPAPFAVYLSAFTWTTVWWREEEVKGKAVDSQAKVRG